MERPAALGADQLRGLSVEALQILVLDRDAIWATRLTQSEAQSSALIAMHADRDRCTAEARAAFERAMR